MTDPALSFRRARSTDVPENVTLLRYRGSVRTALTFLDGVRLQLDIVRYGDLWDRCYASLMAHTTDRLVQEVARLGGHYAHVLDEHIDSKRDDRTDESWLQGRFSYVLYKHV